MSKPDIKPISIKQFETKQSKYDQVQKLPVRGILLGPSGAGKGVLLQNMKLDIYRDCFERVYIFSPSINVDHTWLPVKSYLDNKISLSEDEPSLYYDTYDPESLQAIINTQRKIVEHQKTKRSNKLFSILIIVDDFADDVSFSRNSKLLHSLYVRGRHSQISTLVSTQKFSALSPLIRVNACSLYVFRLRNYQDLNTFLDEVSAIVDRKTLLQMYKSATDLDFGFLFVKLNSRSKKNMFMVKFNSYIEFDES